VKLAEETAPRRQFDDIPEREPLRGKVAALLNERELVINLGTRDGVRPKMRFRVLAAQPFEVPDPDSGEPLGVIVREKVRVQVVEIHANLSICSTYEALRSGRAVTPLRDVLDQPTVRTLRTSDRRHIPPITPAESYVRIGDVVEEVQL
jgi:hypothetical protein